MIVNDITMRLQCFSLRISFIKLLLYLVISIFLDFIKQFQGVMLLFIYVLAIFKVIIHQLARLLFPIFKAIIGGFSVHPCTNQISSSITPKTRPDRSKLKMWRW